MSAPNAGPKRVTLFLAATTGTSQPIDVSAYTNLTLYVTTNGSPGAGTLVIEEADYNPQTQAIYSGTWSLIDTIVLTSDVGNSSQTGYHVGGPGGSFSYGYIRVRWTANVTNTTADVVLRAA